MIGNLYGQQLTIQRAPLVADRYGNQVRDWSKATATEVLGRLETEERRAEEDDGDRSQLEARGVCFLPPGTDILGTDRIVDQFGVRYEVIGQIATLSTPRGPHHLEVRVTSLEG